MKKFAEAIFLFSILFFCFGFAGSNNLSSSQSGKKIIEVGEEITYVVKYLSFEIGEIKLIVQKEEVDGKDTIYSAIAHINSYEGIPFVNLHQIYETKFDQNQISHYFKGSILAEDTTFTEYFFNKRKYTLRVLKGNESKNEIWTDSTIAFNRDCQDGLSLFYFARMRTGKKNKVNVPVLINEKLEKTEINFYDEVEDMDIDAVDYDISCVRLDGETEFRGIFGLTGYFEGWFSNDKYAVPIVAKMQVIIGSVTLELRHWKKKGWMPPKYQD
jgi:hypothetical protein